MPAALAWRLLLVAGLVAPNQPPNQPAVGLDDASREGPTERPAAQEGNAAKRGDVASQDDDGNQGAEAATGDGAEETRPEIRAPLAPIETESIRVNANVDLPQDI